MVPPVFGTGVLTATSQDLAVTTLSHLRQTDLRTVIKGRLLSGFSTCRASKLDPNKRPPPVDSSVTAAWMTPARDAEDLESQPRLERIQMRFEWVTRRGLQALDAEQSISYVQSRTLGVSFGGSGLIGSAGSKGQLLISQSLHQRA
jgi:hypothetical protein